MEYLDKYIPKELLALKINYCKKRLSQLPKVSVHSQNQHGNSTLKLWYGKHRYNLDSAKGKELYSTKSERDELEKQLKIYEAIWDYYYRIPPPVFEPPKIVRTLKTGNGEQVTMNKAFFDSLKNDANNSYPKPMLYPFNGIQYRSAVEVQIATIYTEMGVQFKYEPEIKLIGMKKPQYPDFVLYIPELDVCLIHEHYGLMNLNNYIRDIKLKCGTYTDAGLLIDQDVFFTYNTEDKPLDVRYIAAKLNSVIYGILITSNEWIDNISL